MEGHPPRGRPFTTAAARSPHRACKQAKGAVLGPHTRTPAPTACGQRTPTARQEDERPGEWKRLNSDAPHNGERHAPQESPPATLTARNNGSQSAHAVGPVRGPHAHSKFTQDTRIAEPRLPAPEDGRLGEGQRLTPDAPHNSGRPSPPRGQPPTTSAARSPHRACKPEGQCWAPTPAEPASMARG